MKAESMRCARCRREAVRPDWTSPSWKACAEPFCKKPTEHGFGTELWTLKRVGVVIERLYDVKFGQTQIWRILGTLGFSVQKPEKRAIERDEDSVRSWKRSTCPALKKKPGEKAD
jgi:transposase